MKDLAVRDPFFDELFDFRRDFDKIFNRFLTVKPWSKAEIMPWALGNFVPAVESFVDKDTKKYFCRLYLPGIDPKEVSIFVEGNFLKITGERKLNRTMKELEIYHEEFVYGKFERALELPEGVLIDKMTAESVNGVLEITAPIAAAMLPKKVEIKAVPTLVNKAAA